MSEVREQYIKPSYSGKGETYTYALGEKIPYTDRTYFNKMKQRIKDELTGTIGFCEVIFGSMESLPLLRGVSFVQGVDHMIGIGQRYYTVTELGILAVEPDYQGQGFADALIKEVEEQSKKRGISVVVGKWENGGDHVENMLVRNGFTQIDSSSNWYKVIKDIYQDVT